MKFYLLAMLAVVAGAYAAPQPEAAVAESRIADLWFIDMVQRVTTFLRVQGWDPLTLKDERVEFIFVPRLLEIVAAVDSLNLTGISDIKIVRVYYYLILGRLEFEINIDEIKLDIGGASVNIIYGDAAGSGSASGSLTLNNVGLAGAVLLRYDSWGAWIYNINVSFTIGKILSDLNIVGSQDYTETVNTFLNERVPVLMATYESEINTVVGELIKIFHTWWVDNNNL